MFTAWFLSLKFDPVRHGVYETCARVGGDIARCYWDGEQWLASKRLARRISPAYWRGLSEPPAFPDPDRSTVRIIELVPDVSPETPQSSAVGANDGHGVAVTERPQARPGPVPQPPPAARVSSDQEKVASDGSQDGALSANQFMRTPCHCGGSNENCFRCGGWGYLDKIGEGRSLPVAHGLGPRLTAADREAMRRAEERARLLAGGTGLRECPLCRTLLRKLQRHLRRVHGLSSKAAAEHEGARPHASDPPGLPNARPPTRQAEPRRGSTQPALGDVPPDHFAERALDATRDYYAAYRDHGQFGSHPSHDGYDDESEP